MGDQYVVAIKPSARRINAVAGAHVNRRGPRRAFDSKAAAKAWAEGISADDGAVRVQDVAPNDPASIDGYVVADPARSRMGSSDPSGSGASALDAY